MKGRLSSWLAAWAALAALGLSIGACGGDDHGEVVELLFAPQDNQLDVYDLETGEATTLIAAEDNTVNGQACALPDGSDRFLLGEDTGQDEGARQGWGIFETDGTFVRKILEPETENEPEQPEPFGCGFDANDRLFATDVGDGSFEAENGKLIIFFPPDYEEFCLLDSMLRTAGSIAVSDEGSVYVPQTSPPGQVLRFSPPFPERADECDDIEVNREVFLEDPEVQTPFGIAAAPNGNWYVSSVVIPPAVREYDADGNFVRTIAEGEDIGSPAGIAVDFHGTIYYADLGLVEAAPPVFFEPQAGNGSVRRITFDEEGDPSAPEVLAEGLSFPDAVAVLELPQPK